MEAPTTIPVLQNGARPAPLPDPTPEDTTQPAIKRFRLLRAYLVTMRVLISYGLLRLARPLLGPNRYARRLRARHLVNARRVKNAILELKGLFIKVGQLISIMTNFLPEDFRAELEGLQDRIPPRPLSEIEGRIRKAFGQSPDELFAAFDPNPIASASLAQVHEARLHDGRRVAVKVQHIDIEATVQTDLKAIYRILSIVGAIIKVQGMQAYYTQVREMIEAELDFEQEAAHIEAIAANFVGDPFVAFPEVIHEYSTRRVLTTGFIEGAKITNLNQIERYGLDRQVLAERIVTAYCRMIFSDGLYHADPHPGNILVRPDGTIVFIDFGAVARLSPTMREGLPMLMKGVFQGDTKQIVKAMLHMGFIAHDEKEDVAEQIMAYVKQRFLDEVTSADWRLQDLEVDMETKIQTMIDFRKMNISIRELTSTFQVPRDWVLLERTIALLTGLCTHLDPDMNPFNTIRPYLESFVLGEDPDWTSRIPALLREMAVPMFSIPGDLRTFLDKANTGKLEVRVPDLKASANLLYILGHQLLYGLFSLGTGALAYIAHIRGEAEFVTGFGLTSAFFLLCLGVSMLKARGK